MTNNDKLVKYLLKLKKSNNKKYIKKILYYYQKGGNNSLIKISTNNIKENWGHLKNFLDNIFTSKDLTNPFGKNKFFVILIGSPGSGKSIARKIILNFLKDKLSKTEEIDKIDKSFLDISIDDLVYSLKLDDGLSGLDKLKENYKTFDSDLSNNESTLDELSKSSTDIYFDLRKHINPLGEMFLFLASYLNCNLFFETVGDYPEWIISALIQNICDYYGFIPIIVYPYIDDFEIQKQRIISRASEEGRLPSLKFVEERRKSVEESFEILKTYLNGTESKTKNYYYLKYNNSKPINLTDLSSLEIIDEKLNFEELLS